MHRFPISQFPDIFSIFTSLLSLSFAVLAMSEPEHFRTTYDDIHRLLRASAEKIAEFKPDMLIAIGMH